MIMVVRLECWVRFLVAGRVRLLLPLDLRLTLGLRRANLRHLDSCGSIHPSKDATLVYDSQGSIQKVHLYPAPQDVVLAPMLRSGPIDCFWPYRGGAIQDRESELLRIPLPRTSVNKGKKKAGPPFLGGGMRWPARPRNGIVIQASKFGKHPFRAVTRYSAVCAAHPQRERTS
jgi:hypothetical protein